MACLSCVGAVRVFTEADFRNVDYEGAALTKSQFREYKRMFIGKPVPSQTVGNKELVALGYRLPEPWVQACIEKSLPNWG